MTTALPVVDLLDALLAAADRLDLPLTTRAVRELAAEAGRLLARPADPVGAPPATTDRPSAEQLDNLLGKARARALTAAEVERLAAGLDALRDAALDAGAVRRDPLERGCPLCGARPADHCTTEQGHPARPHRARLRLAV